MRTLINIRWMSWKALLLGLVMTSSLTLRPATWASNAPSITIDPSEIQNFELSYEQWVQELSSSLITHAKPTVLVEMIYTQNPEKIQTYGELRSTQHLPGLPQVMDPHVGHPLENPISALVESRKIKIIFDQALQPGQERLLSEVLNSKLRINARHGDQITLATVDLSASPDTNKKKDKTTNQIAYGIALLALISAVLMRRSLQNKNTTSALNETELNQTPQPKIQKSVPTPPPAPVKPFQFSDQDKEIIKRLQNTHEVLGSTTTSILSPTLNILRCEPKVVIRVIRAENADTLAHALHGSSILFQKTILSICTPAQRNQIKERSQRLNFSKNQTLFAQNLIAAKVHREMSTVGSIQLDQALERFAMARRSADEQKQQARQIKGQIMASLTSNEAPAQNQVSEVQL